MISVEADQTEINGEIRGKESQDSLTRFTQILKSRKTVHTSNAMHSKEIHQRFHSVVGINFIEVGEPIIIIPRLGMGSVMYIAKIYF